MPLCGGLYTTLYHTHNSNHKKAGYIVVSLMIPPGGSCQKRKLLYKKRSRLATISISKNFLEEYKKVNDSRKPRLKATRVEDGEVFDIESISVGKATSDEGHLILPVTFKLAPKIELSFVITPDGEIISSVLWEHVEGSIFAIGLLRVMATIWKLT
jgi:hypothetical protein